MGNAKYKQRHRELGLCTDCSATVYLDREKCLKHIRAHAEHKKKSRLKHIKKITEKDHRYKQARRDNGLCVGCSAPLDPDADSGYLTCVNCRGRIFELRYINGTAIV